MFFTLRTALTRSVGSRVPINRLYSVHDQRASLSTSLNGLRTLMTRSPCSTTTPHPNRCVSIVQQTRYASAKAIASRPKTPLVRIDGQFKTFKPRTPGLRFRRLPLRDHLWKGKPVRNLTVAKRNKGGRNNTGRITVRHRGGGHRRRIRLIDWYRRTPGVHTVVRLEYDPNRTAHIALLRCETTQALSYIIAPNKAVAGDQLVSYMTPTTTNTNKHATNSDESTDTDSMSILQSLNMTPGNCMPLSMVPVGTLVHCIGLRKNGPAQLARAAGTYAQVLQTGKRGYAQIKLSSGEVRRIPVDACATIGTASNPNHQHRIDGKAGVRRWKGWRPTVRGTAMNKVDHPNGGGRGKSKGGRQPTSPWGQLAKGGTTRHRKNPLVVKSRPRR